MSSCQKVSADLFYCGLDVASLVVISPGSTCPPSLSAGLLWAEHGCCRGVQPQLCPEVRGTPQQLFTGWLCCYQDWHCFIPSRVVPSAASLGTAGISGWVGVHSAAKQPERRELHRAPEGGWSPSIAANETTGKVPHLTLKGARWGEQVLWHKGKKKKNKSVWSQPWAVKLPTNWTAHAI